MAHENKKKKTAIKAGGLGYEFFCFVPLGTAYA